MDKKKLILREAAELFAQKGYYGLGLSELLARCGIPKGSFYYYFPGGKMQLIQEVLIDSYQGMAGFIEKVIFTECSAQKAFERMVEHLAHRVTIKPHLASMLMSMIAIESVYLDEGVNETCRELYDQWQKLYADYLRRCGFEEQTAKRKAQAIFALIHGSLLSSWVKQDPQDLLLAKESIADILGEK